MVRRMTAQFTVEGFATDPGIAFDVDAEPSFVSVRLTTDGRAVVIESLYWRENESPMLTPTGWKQLASYADSLVGEANRAWAAMGDTSTSDQPKG